MIIFALGFLPFLKNTLQSVYFKVIITVKCIQIVFLCGYDDLNADKRRQIFEVILYFLWFCISYKLLMITPKAERLENLDDCNLLLRLVQ